ncbi:UDP-N-acetylmuramoyl-L-alanyl-D-glutamate--2,6-diaminopimelate ligase, partial [Arthrospira platensis SPKY1]|nr:UDP-N-acetylmuramoyl-L-alanyl-D-glutamate--2,6-diaminopimelate ligase [Arthrospira platensis SPKY1]
DNPRAEDPEQIFADMRKGLSAEDDACFIADRRRAISIALDAARPGDTVLVAGKGHETFQEFADSVVPFDDRAVIRELLQRKAMLH